MKEAYIKDEIKRITISDIKNWVHEDDMDGYRLFKNKKDAGEFGKNSYGEWSRNLIDKYKKGCVNKLDPCEALKYYSGSAYVGINSYLRFDWHKSISDYLKNIIDNIDVSFSNVPILAENIIVFRYITSKELISHYSSLREGDMIKDKAYISTSLVIDGALNYRGEINCNFVLLVIKIPKGENVIFIDAAVDKYIEYEMLINKNRILKLEKILVKNKKQTVLLCELQK